MIVPEEVRKKWGCSDIDVAIFLDHFEEKEGASILVVGAKEESICEMLVECGFDVVAVDLREMDNPDGDYAYIRSDFCDLYRMNIGQQFDAFVSISAIEHFGLGTYKEGRYHPYYDVIAMRKAWEMLRVGGNAYVTVPVGKDAIEVPPHWRVYNMDSIRKRLVQDFELTLVCCAVAGECEINGVKKQIGDTLTAEEVACYADFTVPHLSALVVMTKVEVKRLAPNGR